MTPLTITICGERMSVTPYAVNGMALLCRGPAQPLCVLEYMVSDRQAFWEAWVSLGGRSQGLVYESGEPVEPPEFGPRQDAADAQGGVPEPSGQEYSI